MQRVRRAYLPAVSLVVLLMAAGSAISGNELGATLFLFAVSGAGLLVAYTEHRRHARRRGSR